MQTGSDTLKLPYEPIVELAQVCRDALLGRRATNRYREPVGLRLRTLADAVAFTIAHWRHVHEVRLVQERLTHVSRRLDVVVLCFACDSGLSLYAERD